MKQQINFFRPIFGAGNICKFMGCGLPYFHRKLRDDMKSYGCIWKADARRKSKWVSTPYLINCYWLLRNKKNIGRHR